METYATGYEFWALFSQIGFLAQPPQLAVRSVDSQRIQIVAIQNRTKTAAPQPQRLP